MKFFPTIKFIDVGDLPDKVVEDCMVYHGLRDPQGVYWYGDGEKEIYVHRQAGSWYVLVHELAHWVVDVCCKTYSWRWEEATAWIHAHIKNDPATMSMSGIYHRVVKWLRFTRKKEL